MLRTCILQMQRQTHPVDHVVYLNGDPSAAALTADLVGPTTRISVGPNLDQHSNHMAALAMAGDSDLYFKIDDDDLYRPDYVRHVVDAYDGTWDYSAGYSDGIVFGSEFRRGVLHSLCVDPTQEEVRKGVVMYMPSTLVLNPTGLSVIRGLSDDEVDHAYEDIVWRNRLWDSDARFFLRSDPVFTRDFTYVVHGANISTSGWLTGNGG
jgi:hypothetical protein